MKTEKTKKGSPNQDSFRRLQFFSDFLSLMNIQYKDVGQLLNISPASVAHWFAVDDVKLSYIQTIIENYGYHFEIFLSREQDELTADSKVDVDDFIVIPGTSVVPKRMTFLLLALKRYDITKTELASRLGIQYSTIRYWFATDDCTIARCFEIGTLFDLSIRIRIYKNKEEQSLIKRKTRTPKRYFSVQFTTDEVYEF